MALQTYMVAGLTVARLLLGDSLQKDEPGNCSSRQLITAKIGFALLTFSPDFAALLP